MTQAEPQITEEDLRFYGETGPLFLALARAQAAFKPVLKNTKQAHYGKDYADLSAHLNAVRDALNANNIYFGQFVGTLNEARQVTVHTVIALGADKGEGARIISKATISRGNGKGEQGDGSSISYLRRYTMQAALGLASEDDDANAGMGTLLPKKKEDKTIAPKPPPKRKKKAAPNKPPAEPQGGGSWQKAPDVLPPREKHPTWTKESSRAFMAQAIMHVVKAPGQSDMDAIVFRLQELGIQKRPSQMDNQERGQAMAELAGEMF